MQLLPVADLTPHPQNDYYFDDIAGEAWDEFLRSIQTSGVIEPVIINQNKMIISGHQRVRACKELGITEIMTECKSNDKYDSDFTYAYVISNINHIRLKTRLSSPVKIGRCIRAIAEYQSAINNRIKIIKELYCAKHKNIVENCRSEILNKHGRICHICGNTCEDILHIHFRVPLEEWGDSDNNNLMILCPNCHSIIHKYISSVNKKNLENEEELSHLSEWLKENYTTKSFENILKEFEYYIINRNNYCIDKAMENLDITF